ncbi:MAG: NADAR family protein [Planctomycetaceae bacterium]|nr:NADAR family protein [Planctomycetaceae bacterium]
MRLTEKQEMLVLLPETDAEQKQLARMATAWEGHVFELVAGPSGELRLISKGPASDVLDRSIEIAEPESRAEFATLANFSPTRFELDGHSFASLESFWQSLKFNDAAERIGVGNRSAPAARQLGRSARLPEYIRYFGQIVVPGTPDHWQILRRAALAKFSQNSDARDALIATGHRPLYRDLPKPDPLLPNAVLSEIWHSLRKLFRQPPSQPFVGGVIDGFSGGYRWLSNFWPSRVTLDGQAYPTVEHAYQAAKFLDVQDRARIAAIPAPGDAKRLAKSMCVRSDWDSVRLPVMDSLLRQKFDDPELRRQLSETYPLQLAETNDWGDVFWGNCNGIGENHLGRLLMEIRESQV